MCSSLPSWFLYNFIGLLSASLAGAVAQQVDLEPVDEMCLLQTGFAVERQLEIAEAARRKGSSNWFEWRTRLPELEDANATQVWNHLGEQWWMQFIDGQFHKDGPHALDHTKNTGGRGADGEFYQHSKDLYERFSVPSQWEALLTADNIAQVNAEHRAVSCKNASCDELYRQYNQEKCINHLRVLDNCSVQLARSYMQGLLNDYYKATLTLQGLDRHTRLQKGLPELAKLFGKIAEFHPFMDANSRTRLLILQIELVRLGGHPVVLWGFREEVYHDECINGLECGARMQDLILEGWCAWESLATSGKSPFQAGQYKTCYDTSAKSCLANPKPALEPGTANMHDVEGKTGVIDKDA